MMTREVARALLIGGLFVGWALLIYAPAISHYLTFDDFAHVQPLLAPGALDSPLGIWEALWSSGGPLGRPLAIGSFILQIRLGGADVVGLKVGNVLIHAATGLVLLGMSLRLLTLLRVETAPSAFSWTVATLSALIWLSHPFNLLSVAYTVQRMNSLSALFTLAAVWLYLIWRQRHGFAAGLRHSLPGVLLLAGLAVLAKENGVLIVVYLLVTEGVLADRQPGGWRIVVVPRLRWALGMVVLALLLWAWLVMWPGIMAGYGIREFTLEERLLTELRVLVWYLGSLLAPDISSMGLYHDDWGLSSSLFTPATTWQALLVLLGIGGAVWRLRGRFPLLAWGYAWFLGGHLLESTVLPLELVFEHRNYVPGFGLILGTLGTLGQVVENGRAARAFVALGVVLVLLVGWATHTRALRWADDPAVRIDHLSSQTHSMRALVEAAETLKEGMAVAQGEARRHLFDRAEGLFALADVAMPDSADPLFGWVMLYLDTGRPPPERLLADLTTRLATGPVTKITLNGLHAVALGAIRRPVLLPAQRVESWLDAVEANPHLDGFGPGAVWLERGRFLFFGRGAIEPALELMRQAAAAEPQGIDVGLELATMLGLAGRRGEAIAELARVDRLDPWGKRLDSRTKLRLALLANTLRMPKDARPAQGDTP